MKLTFKHTALSLALAGSFALTGCNFIGDGDAVFTDPVMTVEFDGKAIKGPFLNADVSAYQFGNLTDALVAQISTNDTGLYNFIADVNDSVIIDVVGNSNSTFICDIPAGCGVNGEFAVNGNVPADGLTLSTVAYVDAGQTTSTTQANVISTAATAIMRANSSFQSNNSEAREQLKKVTFDLLGLTDAEQSNDLNPFTLNLVPGNDLSSATSNAIKKLSALNATFASLTTNNQSIINKINLFSTVISDAANATGTLEDKQAALNAAANVIIDIQEEAKEIDPTLTFEVPSIEIDGTEFTGTGTGTGSGSNSGGMN